jgi:hypothetical protein
MKKRMKMKKYAEGGMSDDDEGYDAYTTRVVDEDTDEVIYEKPGPKYKESKPAAKKAAPKKAEPKKAKPKEPEAYRDFSKLARGAKRDLAGFKSGGSVKSSASKRADGIAQRGKTKGRMV